MLISSREAAAYGPRLEAAAARDSSEARARARRSPPSSAEPADALVPAAPLAGGRCFGIAAEWIFFGWGDPRDWVPDLVTGWTLIACGLVAWSRRPTAEAALMAATGFSWFLGNFATSGVDPVDWLGAHALYLYRGPLVHLLVTYPRGRLSSRLDRVAVGIGYAAAVVTPVWRSEIATIVLAALLVAVCARLYVRAVGPSRRARLLALWAAAGLGLVLAGGAAARLARPPVPVSRRFSRSRRRSALAGALLAGLLSPSWQRAAVTDLVVELGESRSGTLRDELARALGDPTLDVGYWLPNAGDFVDARPAVCPSRPGSERSVTMIEGDGDRSPRSSTTRPCSTIRPPRGVSSAAQLAAANARLQAEVRAQLAALRESRRRILEAATRERQRLERRLREGAEERLEGLAEQLRRARSPRERRCQERIERTEAQLARTLEELRGLRTGSIPAS